MRAQEGESTCGRMSAASSSAAPLKLRSPESSLTSPDASSKWLDESTCSWRARPEMSARKDVNSLAVVMSSSALRPSDASSVRRSPNLSVVSTS